MTWAVPHGSSRKRAAADAPGRRFMRQFYDMALGLEHHGIRNVNAAYWNLGTAKLLEHAIQRREGNMASGGAFVVRTGQFTGRSPKDKYIVRESGTENAVNWGSVNQAMTEAQF